MNPYEVLGLPITATKTQASAAYRRLAKKYHPDVNPTADAEPMMKRINAAYGMIQKGYRPRLMPVVPPKPRYGYAVYVYSSGNVAATISSITGEIRWL